MSDALVLLITIHLHDGRYHGIGDGIGDYPPAPARLFQALVAGAGLSGPHVLEEHAAALQWLEALHPPVIAAPREAVGQEFRNYVPQNDLDAYRGDPRRIHSIRAAKTIRPHLFHSDLPLLYAWRFNGDADDGKQADVVCKLAERLYQFGRGEDLAWAWGEVLGEAELEDRLSGHSGVVYRPSKGGTGVALLCPGRGTLESLSERYQASGRRFRTSGEGRRKATIFAQPPRPSFLHFAYNSPPERLVYTLRDNAGAFRSWPLIRALKLTQAVRDAAAIRLRQALPARTAEIERIFIGRKANGNDDGAVAERVRIIPLPTSGHDFADRGIRRVLVEVPRECPLRADDVAWALSGLRLADSDTGEVLDSVLTRALKDTMPTRYGVDAEFRTWRTVTPAALPGWIWRGIKAVPGTPGPNNARRIVLERAAEAVMKTLRFSNVMARVESVRVQREPFDARGKPATAFEVGTRFDERRLWHVEISFESPVVGPLVIGDGRFLGMGLMEPVTGEPKSRNGGAGTAFITPHAVHQFQERIERLPYSQALTAIIHSLDTAEAPRATANGMAVYVRTRSPHRFRAILRPPDQGRKLPSVVTILKG
ncbi:MAG: type I-U CRISPR-associated protein Csb2 [Dehalococcoidia bacterium]